MSGFAWRCSLSSASQRSTYRILMQVMDTSLDRLYKSMKAQGNSMLESELAQVFIKLQFLCIVLSLSAESNVITFYLCGLCLQVSFSIVSALHYLHQQLRVIHRDVKPSNILADKTGCVKLCDFGISAYLIDSIARTRDAGLMKH